MPQLVAGGGVCDGRAESVSTDPEAGSVSKPGGIAAAGVGVGRVSVHSRCRAHAHVGEKEEEGLSAQGARLVHEEFRCDGRVPFFGDIRQEAESFRRKASMCVAGGLGMISSSAPPSFHQSPRLLPVD
jgi:hypothetical protein